MRSMLFAGALGLLLLAGCALVDDNDPSAMKDDNLQSLDGLGDVLVLVEGERLALPSHNDAWLTFVERLEDSRCPKDVDCVWEGQVKLLMTFARTGQATTSFELVGFVGPDGYEEGSPPRVTHDAGGFRFTLERLDPYPDTRVEQTNAPAATIRVEQR